MLTPELSAAQLPQILEMHDASNRNHVGPRSRKPPRGNHDPGPGRSAHHNSMGPPDARAPPRPQTLVSAVGHPEKSDHRRRRCTRAPSGTIWFLIRDFRTIKDEDSLDPVGGKRVCCNYSSSGHQVGNIGWYRVLYHPSNHPIVLNNIADHRCPLLDQFAPRLDRDPRPCQHEGIVM